MASHLMQKNHEEGPDSHVATPRLPQLNQNGVESRLRHLVWGGMILLVGALTMFGYWFLFAG